MKKDPKKITAITMIEKLLDCISYMPEPEEWDFEVQKENPPRLIRLKQLSVMMKLFLPAYSKNRLLRENMSSLLSGEFIEQSGIDAYKDVCADMDRMISAAKFRRQNYLNWEPRLIRNHYENVLRYRQKMEELLGFNAGIIETSYYYCYYSLLTDSVSDTINTKPLDDFLAAVIDPKKTVYLKKDLVLNDQYPPEDLNEVDMDWL
jgi:hypothetical protein